MKQLTVTTRWVMVMAALAMLLSLRAAHSPLQHCHVSLESQADSAESGVVTGARHHAHHHHHHHAHAAHTHHQPGSPEPGHAPCDDHSHCQLCEFLAQPLTSIELPVAVLGEEQIEQAASAAEIVVSLPLQYRPQVRGPPFAC